jgi:acyl carrier protein
VSIHLSSGLVKTWEHLSHARRAAGAFVALRDERPLIACGRCPCRVRPPGRIADGIESFIRTRFTVSPEDPLFSQDADLFELDYVDLVGVAELLEFLHEQFGVEVSEEDLLSDDFSTIKGISRVVEEFI